MAVHLLTMTSIVAAAFSTRPLLPYFVSLDPSGLCALTQTGFVEFYFKML
jgi:hypothetical protein